MLNQYDFSASLSSMTYQDQYIYEPSMNSVFIDLRYILCFDQTMS